MGMDQSPSELVHAILDRTTVRAVVNMRLVSAHLSACAMAWLTRYRRAFSGTFAGLVADFIDAISRDDVEHVAALLALRRLPLDQPLFKSKIYVGGAVYDISVFKRTHGSRSISGHAFVSLNGCTWTPIEIAVATGAHNVLEFMLHIGARYHFGVEALIEQALTQCDVTIERYDCRVYTPTGLPADLLWRKPYCARTIIRTLLASMPRSRFLRPTDLNPLTVLRNQLDCCLHDRISVHGPSAGVAEIMDSLTSRVPWMALSTLLINKGGYSPDEPHAPGGESERDNAKREMRLLALRADISVHARAMHIITSMLLMLYCHPFPDTNRVSTVSPGPE